MARQRVGGSFQRCLLVQLKQQAAIFHRQRRRTLTAKLYARPTSETGGNQETFRLTAMEDQIKRRRSENDRADHEGKAENKSEDEMDLTHARRDCFAAIRSACSACSACRRTSPRCRAEMPSAAARAAESVVMVVMRAVTAARRIAFSSKYGSGPCGVLTISWMRSALIRPTALGAPSFTL